MTNFQIIPYDEYTEIEEIIFKFVPEFMDSTQYLELDKDLKLPNLLMARFNNFFIEQYDKNPNSEMVKKSILLFNFLSQSDDSSLKNHLIINVFETFSFNNQIEQEVISKLCKEGQNLYKDWAKKYLS